MIGYVLQLFLRRHHPVQLADIVLKVFLDSRLNTSLQSPGSSS